MFSKNKKIIKFVFLVITITITFLSFNFPQLAQTTLVTTQNNSSVSTPSVSQSSANSSSSTSSGIIIKNSTGSNFSLKLTAGVQDIFSLNIPIQLDIESFIDADRFELSQIISPDPEAVKLTIPSNNITSLKRGDKKTFILYATPKKSGLVSIYLTGQAWQNALTLTDVAFVTINFDKNLWVTPQSDEFKSNLQTWENIKTFVNIVFIIIVLLILFVLVRKFAKWWKRD